MEVTAAESERADGRPPRMIGIGDPRSSFGVHAEGRLAGLECIERLADLDRWWQHLVMKCQSRLDKPRRSRRCFGMPDLRFHRTDRTPGSFGPSVAIDLSKCRSFDTIADLGA